MPWETITAERKEIDEEIATFESGVSSIDDFSITGHGSNTVTALLQYTA